MVRLPFVQPSPGCELAEGKVVACCGEEGVTAADCRLDGGDAAGRCKYEPNVSY